MGATVGALNILQVEIAGRPCKFQWFVLGLLAVFRVSTVYSDLNGI